MDGVRRWIRASSPMRRSSVRIESRASPTSSSNKLDPRPDRSSTAYLAGALLDPVVPAEEKQEYKDYIDQGQEMLDLPPDWAEPKDQLVYEHAIALAAAGEEDADERWIPPEKDVDVFCAFVEKGSPLVVETEGSQQFLPITFDYGRWTAG